MPMFRKKPVVIEAVQWTGKNLREIITFTDGPPETRSHHAGMKWEEYENLVARDGLKIFTMEGTMIASVGDWIIRGVKNEFYPCKPDIFAATYEAVEGEKSASIDSLVCSMDAEKLVALVMLLTGGSANPHVVRGQIENARERAGQK